jgi:hypothetical protein
MSHNLARVQLTRTVPRFMHRDVHHHNYNIPPLNLIVKRLILTFEIS